MFKTYLKMKTFVLILASILSFVSGTSLIAASCKQEVQKSVKGIEAKDGFDNHVDILLIDINSDGRDEILFSEVCSGNGCYPDFGIVYFTETCQRNYKWLDRWTGVFGLHEIDFFSDDKFAYISGRDGRYDIGLNELNKVHITYKFDGKSVEYSSTRKADLVQSVREITSTEVAQKNADEQTITMEYDLNGDGKLESISCGYWERWGVLNPCEISSQNSDNSLLAEEYLNPKRLGVLTDKSNGWHILVKDYENLLVYKTDVGYIELDSLFEVSDRMDFFGDDLTEMGHKGITSQECQLICLENEKCAAYSYIKSKKWCFPKHGKGNVKADLDVLSGVLSARAASNAIQKTGASDQYGLPKIYSEVLASVSKNNRN